MEQQRPCTASGIPSCPARRRWFQSWRVRPTRVCPCARRSAATAEESTPPDIATAMVSLSFWVAWGMMLCFGTSLLFSHFYRFFERLHDFLEVVCPQTNASFESEHFTGRGRKSWRIFCFDWMNNML